MEYAHDACYFGDVIAAEQRWFSDPFVQGFPVFRELFMNFNIPAISRKISSSVDNFITGNNDNGSKIPDYLINIAALYYSLLKVYFGSILNTKGPFSNFIGACTTNWEKMGFYPISLTSGDVDGSDAFQILDGIWNGDAFGCPLRARFIEAVDQMRRGGWRNLSLLDGHVDDLMEFDGRILPEISIFWQKDLFIKNFDSRKKARNSKARCDAVGGTPGIPLSLYPMEGQHEIDIVRNILFSKSSYGQVCANLFEVYDKGLGVKKDFQKAEFWISRAAKVNPDDYLLPHGVFLFEEAKSRGEQEKALEKIKRAASRNTRGAVLKLVEIARAYPSLTVMTLQKLKEAAERRNAVHAQFALGAWLLTDNDTPSDQAEAQARQWLKRAGDGGNMEAIALLQKLHEKGGGFS